MARSVRDRTQIAVVATILVGSFFYLGNPSSVHHDEAIRREFSEIHPLFEPLGVDISARSIPRYRSLLVASVTTRERAVASFGVLGRVWVFPSSFAEPLPVAPGSAVVTPDSVHFVE